MRPGSSVSRGIGASVGTLGSESQAVRLDGASQWQIFCTFTWPGMALARFYMIVTSITGSFQVVERVFILSQGGPVGSTNALTNDISVMPPATFSSATPLPKWCCCLSECSLSRPYDQRNQEE